MDHQQSNNNQYVDIREVINIIAKHWYYFVISLVLCISIVLLVHKYAPRKFMASSTILINPNEENRSIGDAFMSELDIFSPQKNLYNEILTLQSQPLIVRAIADLNFEVSYYKKIFLSSYEIYNESPFVVEFDHSHNQPVNVKISIVFTDSANLQIQLEKKEVQLFNFEEDAEIGLPRKVVINKTVHLGEKVEDSNYSFVVLLKDNKAIKEMAEEEYQFMIDTKLAKKYKKALVIAPVEEETTAVIISVNDENPQKALDFITSLTNNYLDYNLEKKNFIALNTIDYIDRQLGEIEDSLSRTESRLQSYQVANQVMDVNAKSQRLYAQIQELEVRKENFALEARYYDYINDYFSKNDKMVDVMAPSAMGIDDPILTGLIEELSTVDARISMMETNNQQKSPYFNELVQKKDNLKRTIRENINYIVNTSNNNLVEINKKLHALENELNRLPRTQRELVGIERKFHLNDAIYTFMLEKRTEAQIAKASNLPDNEIIEPPQIIGVTFPNTQINMVLALFIGLLIPGSILIMKSLLNNKINSQKDIKNITNLPIIGIVPHTKSSLSQLLIDEPNSLYAEAYRMIKSNLDFFNSDKQNQIIVVTSFFPNEGKSLTAANLALSLSLFGKRTVLVGFDLRNPTVHEHFNVSNTIGVSTFLINKALFDDIVTNKLNKNLDIITSGEIPPNPTELIASDKTTELFEILKERYDYIIVDTPPIELVADIDYLMKRADMNIIVARQRHTNKFAFHDALVRLSEKKYSNTSLILNDYMYDTTTSSYEKKYYKYYGHKKKRFSFFGKK